MALGTWGRWHVLGTLVWGVRGTEPAWAGDLGQRLMGTCLALLCAGELIWGWYQGHWDEGHAPGFTFGTERRGPCFWGRGLWIWGWDRGQAPGAVRTELRGVSEHKALLVGPPPGLRGWERTAVPCVRSLLGLPAGGNVVFSSRSCRSGRAEGLGVRGQAGLGTHTAPLCSLDEVLAGPWPGLAPLPPLRGGLGLHLAPVGTGWVPAATGVGCWGLSQAPILGQGAGG